MRLTNIKKNNVKMNKGGGKKNKKKKRGAMMIYVAIAILIVAVGIFTFSIVQKMRKPSETSIWFKSFIVDCIEKWLDDVIINIDFCQPGQDKDQGQGQVMCFPYGSAKYPLFCYNDVPGQDCILVDPTIPLNNFFDMLKGNATLCINDAKQKAIDKGYEVNFINYVDIKNFKSTFRYTKIHLNTSLTFKKGDDISSFDEFEIETKPLNVLWKNFEKFKPLVLAIASNESVGDLTLADLDAMTKLLCVGCTILTISSIGCNIKVYEISDRNEKFTFGIREIKNPFLKETCYIVFT